MGVRRIVGTARAVARLRHNRGRLLALRDVQTFLRLQCIGSLTRSGLTQALRHPGSADELVQRAGLTDRDLAEALLDLGVALRQVRRNGDAYRLRGARMRAVASGSAPDVAGLVEEATAYDSPIYAAMDQHLRGLGPQPYDAGLGDVVARVSRVAEPMVGPWIAARAGSARAQRALDVGCGTAVNLRWMADALPEADLVGIDRDVGAIAAASANVRAWGLDGRVETRTANLDSLPEELGGPWDLVLLAQNIYYWPVDERASVLRRLRDLTGGRGTALVLSAVPSRAAIGRHLDVVLRVTEGCYRLPTMAELRSDALAAGFTSVRVRDLAPGLGMAGMVAAG
jgi:predicted O-methyltransferase YrrM